MARDADLYLPCFREGQRLTARITKAARAAESDPALRRKLEQQAAFDEQMVKAIAALPLPDSVRERLAAESQAKSAESSLRITHPAVLSAIASILLVIGFTAYTEWNRRAGFAGKEALQQMISAANRMTGVELDPTNAPAAELADALYVRGFEDFILPPDLGALPVVGSRVFKQNNRPIAQLAIDERHALLYVFRASEFGVDAERIQDWRVFSQDGWAAAVRAREGVCTMFTFRGDEQEMKEFLAGLKL